MNSTPKNFQLPFIRKEKIARDIYSFYFNRLANADFDFVAGQYIRMILNIANPDERGTSRFFTVASSPLEKQYIMITTKIIKSSFKKKLLELWPKDMVKFYGPIGGFILNEEDKHERVFLAGGIGITPFHSMITYLHAKNLSIPITLIASFSTIEDLIFYEELSDIAKENPRIKVIYTISHPEKSFQNSFRHSRESGNPIRSFAENDGFEIAFEGSRKSWNCETGRITDALIKKFISNIFEPLYYIVGPPVMVAAIEDTVRKMGVANDKIFIENFTGY